MDAASVGSGLDPTSAAGKGTAPAWSRSARIVDFVTKCKARCGTNDRVGKGGGVLDWKWQEERGVGFWRVSFLEAAGRKVRCGAVFSSRQGGTSRGAYRSLNLGAAVGDDPECVERNRTRFAAAAGFRAEACVRVNQVHGSLAVEVRTPGVGATADAMVTAERNLILSVGTADCVPIYLLDPERGVIALCHAGWRGTVAGVAVNALRAMRDTWGCTPERIWAAIGPSIGPCCYEVDAPLIDRVEAHLPWSDDVLGRRSTGHAHLNLWEANRKALVASGVEPEQISVAHLCTACSEALLFSHRRDRGQTGRMEAALWMEA